MQLVERNFRTRYGEIDLIMLDRDCLVFVEVRVRNPSRWSGAAESVDLGKQRKLTLTADIYASKNAVWANSPMRFDVVAIEQPGQRDQEMTWIADAFRP